MFIGKPVWPQRQREGVACLAIYAAIVAAGSEDGGGGNIARAVCCLCQLSGESECGNGTLSMKGGTEKEVDGLIGRGRGTRDDGVGIKNGRKRRQRGRELMDRCDGRPRPSVETGPKVLIMRANYCLLGLKQQLFFECCAVFTNDLVNHIVVSYFRVRYGSETMGFESHTSPWIIMGNDHVPV